MMNEMIEILSKKVSPEIKHRFTYFAIQKKLKEKFIGTLLEFIGTFAPTLSSIRNKIQKK